MYQRAALSHRGIPLTDIQTEIDRFVADLQARGVDRFQLAAELTAAVSALVFSIPIELVRSGDRAAIEREIVLRA
jgi:hypothetical protein